MCSGGFCISIVASDWGQCVPWNGIISAECYCLAATDPAQQLPSAHPFGTCWHLTTLLSWASIWLQHFRPLTCRPVAIFSVAACFRMLSSGQWDSSPNQNDHLAHEGFWSSWDSNWLPNVFAQHAFTWRKKLSRQCVCWQLLKRVKLVWCIKEIN